MDMDIAIPRDKKGSKYNGDGWQDNVYRKENQSVKKEA